MSLLEIIMASVKSLRTAIAWFLRHLPPDQRRRRRQRNPSGRVSPTGRQTRTRTIMTRDRGPRQHSNRVLAHLTAAMCELGQHEAAIAKVNGWLSLCTFPKSRAAARASY
ncbi:hypothetical protein F4782DRAFT_517658 [Xylaria castorea]|nr:hypothetical protein F4782DRAFT_517658 [Xylaria castorea]